MTSESLLFSSPRRRQDTPVSPSIRQRLPIDIEGTFQKLSPSPPGQEDLGTTFGDMVMTQPSAVTVSHPTTATDRLPPSHPLLQTPVQPPPPEELFLPATSPQETAPLPEFQPLAQFLQAEQTIPRSLTLVLTEPRAQWVLVQGQPTLALLQDVVSPDDIPAQAMAISGVPMQPTAHVQPQRQPTEDTKPPDSHQVAAELILRYLEDHEPPVPGQEDERRPTEQDNEENEDDASENDTRRQAAKLAAQPHPPVRPSRDPQL